MKWNRLTKTSTNLPPFDEPVLVRGKKLNTVYNYPIGKTKTMPVIVMFRTKDEYHSAGWRWTSYGWAGNISPFDVSAWAEIPE